MELGRQNDLACFVIADSKFHGHEFEHLRSGETAEIADQEKIGEVEIFGMIQLSAETRDFFAQITGNDGSWNVFENVHEGFYLSFKVHRLDDRIPDVALWHRRK